MHPEDKERLIQLIIHEVLTALAGSGSVTPPPQAVAVSEAASASISSRRSERLITLTLVQEWAQQGLKHLELEPTCIVTPSALDLLRTAGITLERRTAVFAATGQEDKQKPVAIVARFLYRMQWQAIEDALNACKRNGVVIPVSRGARDLEPQLETIRSRIKNDELDAAIIIDEQVNLLYTRLARQDGLRPLIGWSVKSAAGQRLSTQANVLVLNYRSFGPLNLREMIIAWLSPGRSE